MDFNKILEVAKKNEEYGREVAQVRRYSTQLSAPKKQVKEKKLSANIQKFLARKEDEERRKKEEATKKKEELLALRNQDKKAMKRVGCMLNRTKSANKSVIADAVDNDNTAITRSGLIQPDEDDYGYVSLESSALYSKIMDKYMTATKEKDLFSKSKPKTVKDLSSTKDRVRETLMREAEEEASGHRKKRKTKDEKLKELEESDSKALHERQNRETDREKDIERRRRNERDYEEMPPPRIPKRAPPPPMSFQEILRLAEEKKNIPIVFEPKVVKKEREEPERLMTKKQKLEFEREKEWRLRKEGKLPPLSAGNEKKTKANGANGRANLKGSNERNVDRRMGQQSSYNRDEDSRMSNSRSQYYEERTSAERQYRRSPSDTGRDDEERSRSRSPVRRPSDANRDREERFNARKPVRRPSYDSYREPEERFSSRSPVQHYSDSNRDREEKVSARKPPQRPPDVNHEERRSANRPVQKLASDSVRGREERFSNGRPVQRQPSESNYNREERFSNNRPVQQRYSESNYDHEDRGERFSNSRPAQQRSSESNYDHEDREERFSNSRPAQQRSSESNYDREERFSNSRPAQQRSSESNYDHEDREQRLSNSRPVQRSSSGLKREREEKYGGDRPVQRPSLDSSRNREGRFQEQSSYQHSSSNRDQEQFNDNRQVQRPSNNISRGHITSASERTNNFSGRYNDDERNRGKESKAQEYRDSLERCDSDRVVNSDRNKSFKERRPMQSQSYDDRSRQSVQSRDQSKDSKPPGFVKDQTRKDRGRETVPSTSRTNEKESPRYSRPLQPTDSVQSKQGRNIQQPDRSKDSISVVTNSQRDPQKSSVSSVNRDRPSDTRDKRPSGSRLAQQAQKRFSGSQDSPRDENIKSGGYTKGQRDVEGSRSSGQQNGKYPKPSMSKSQPAQPSLNQRELAQKRPVQGSSEKYKVPNNKLSSDNRLAPPQQRVSEKDDRSVKSDQFGSKNGQRQPLPSRGVQSQVKGASRSEPVKSREFPPKDVVPRQFPPKDVVPRQFPPKDVMPRQFPPPDVRRRPQKPKKRRIDSDEEYDSDLADFIDDGQEEEEDYSKYIKEIFGYDKSRYRDEAEDAECMESSFGQQLKEEFYSTKMGILEDLEDIRREELEKKTKRKKALVSMAAKKKKK